MLLRPRSRARPVGLAAAPAAHPITIRPAYSDDAKAIVRLAALDSAPVPSRPILLAEVDGELRAALSRDGGAVIADPFFPTVHLVELLRLHAAASAPAAARGRSLRPRFAH